MRFDAAQAVLFIRDALRDLGLANAEHSSELIERRLLVEQSTDLVKAEAQVTQGHESVEPAKLANCVGPVAGHRVDPGGLQQSELVVMPQHPG